MNKFFSGFVADNILLSIGRAILRKQSRDERAISDSEALGHAMVIQGRYRFVDEGDGQRFCQEVLRAFRFVEQRELQSVSRLAYVDFQKDQLSNNSILDDELICDLEMGQRQF